jgi:pimeloyl-ACP methyl ester carboxylesterase
VDADMNPPQRVTVPTPSGVRIAADEWPGDGPAVVLAHGGGQTRHSWGGTAAVLADRGHRVVSIDLRGHGDSDVGARRRLLDVGVSRRRALGGASGSMSPVVWVGASLGGMTGLHAVDDAPRAFRRTRARRHHAPAGQPQGVERILEFMNDKAVEGFAAVEEAADAIAAYQPHRPRPSDLSGLRKNLRLGEDGRWRWHWDPAFLDERTGGTSEHARDRHHDELEAMARRLTIPTMLVRGKLSDLVTEDEVADSARWCPTRSTSTSPTPPT